MSLHISFRSPQDSGLAGRLEPKELDTLLGELTLMNARAELYLRCRELCSGVVSCQPSHHIELYYICIESVISYEM